MKKTLLAAALVAGFAGVAHAESSVTLYGLVDAGYGYQGTETKFRGDYDHGKITTRDFGLHSSVMNGSRWGLKGKEDLGNGTSAIFVLESGFDVTNGHHSQGGRLFGRQAYVGLSGDSWGTFTLGRQYNAGDTFVAPIDPFGTGGGWAAANRIFGDSVSGRHDGVIKYVSPNFSGFQFGIGVIHDDSETKVSGDIVANDYKITSRTVGVTSGLGYTSGPIYVGASFDYVDVKSRNSIAPDAATRAKTKAWNIGGTYDFDVVKLHLLYGGQADGAVLDSIGMAGFDYLGSVGAQGVDTNTFATEGLKQHSWLAGLSAPVGDAGKVMFSYAGNTIKNKDVAENVKIKSHNFALGYRHSLSKRTSVYGVASYGWSEAKERYTGFSGKAKTTATQAIIGLQHRF
ncbi:MAG: porin [Alcaligenaceae bacterium]|nr:porin [Alcaligenaceae bacterium]